jgi:hypothetical protein
MFSSHRASTRLRGKRQQENEKKYISWLYEIKNFFHFFFLARLCEIRIMKSRLAREISSHTQKGQRGRAREMDFSLPAPQKKKKTKLTSTAVNHVIPGEVITHETGFLRYEFRPPRLF